MAIRTADLDNDVLFYGYLPEYLDDCLPADVVERYNKIASGEKMSEVPTKYGKVRGNLQLAFQELGADELLMQKLAILVEDDATRAKHEDRHINTIERSEMFGNIARSIIIFGSILIMVFAAVYYLTPKSKSTFDILNSLKWEAIALEEDPDRMMDIPTTNLLEVNEFIKNNRELGFKYRPVNKFQNGWEVEGTSLFDYIFAKIIAIKFRNPRIGENLYFFLLTGTLADLPKADPGNHGGLLFQAYGVNNIEIIAWQYDENVLGIMVSNRSSIEMAELAKVATGI